jgi:nitroimidazol reductase NimA-like FMN-containing flavoprotein (pyridoxamine 5'-phosphate oxidase superfamily)
MPCKIRTHMRKKERAITDKREIEGILRTARILRLGITEDGAPPYIVPVNFGYRDGAIYFHSSPQGRKMELIAKNPLVSFEAEVDVSVIAPPDPTDACDWGTAYRSVIGHGWAVTLGDAAEKREGLRVIMGGVAPDIDPASFSFPEKIVSITAVVRIDIERMTGKKHRV